MARINQRLGDDAWLIIWGWLLDPPPEPSLNLDSNSAIVSLDFGTVLVSLLVGVSEGELGTGGGVPVTGGGLGVSVDDATSGGACWFLIGMIKKECLVRWRKN